MVEYRVPFRGAAEPLKHLVKKALVRVRFEPDVSGTFDAAIDARNSFVHSFFWERAEAFADSARHGALLDELRELTQLFFSAQKYAEMLRNLYLQQVDENTGGRRNA